MRLKKAFSLIELLMVIAVIGIMTAAGLTSYAGTKNKRAVETEARKVAASIREAQNYALVGRIGPSGNAPYEIQWQTFDSPNYLVRAAIKTGAGVDWRYSNYSNDIVWYSLQNGVVFSSGASSSSPIAFRFSVPFGSVTYWNAPNKKVTLKKGSYCEDIIVGDLGSVTEGPVYTGTGC